ncbi:MAG: hypothetical protein KDC99_15740 [Cyclobacteriaceae bacterium]|nr:hypothetical protein [Cyclobacteriaceae bacterium]
MKHLEVYLIPYVVSNAVALFMLWSAWKKPVLARLLFFILFFWAFIMNLTTALTNPNDYLNYSEMAVAWYKSFIDGWFKDHITIVVVAIAIGQALIAIGIILNGTLVRLAAIGAILFLIGIAPLGVGSAFPFSITASVAAWLIIRRKNLEYLWKFWQPKST